MTPDYQVTTHSPSSRPQQLRPEEGCNEIYAPLGIPSSMISVSIINLTISSTSTTTFPMEDRPSEVVVGVSPLATMRKASRLHRLPRTTKSCRRLRPSTPFVEAAAKHFNIAVDNSPKSEAMPKANRGFDSVKPKEGCYNEDVTVNLRSARLSTNDMWKVPLRIWTGPWLREHNLENVLVSPASNSITRSSIHPIRTWVSCQKIDAAEFGYDGAGYIAKPVPHFEQIKDLKYLDSRQFTITSFRESIVRF